MNSKYTPSESCLILFGTQQLLFTTVQYLLTTFVTLVGLVLYNLIVEAEHSKKFISGGESKEINCMVIQLLLIKREMADNIAPEKYLTLILAFMLNWT